MKTIELAKKALTRVAEVAVTQAQFDKWDSGKKRQWLKDHPTSKFGKGASTKADKKAPAKADKKRQASKARPSDKESAMREKLEAQLSKLEDRDEDLDNDRIRAIDAVYDKAYRKIDALKKKKAPKGVPVSTSKKAMEKEIKDLLKKAQDERDAIDVRYDKVSDSLYAKIKEIETKLKNLK